MKGLFLKDFYVALKNLRAYFVMILAFTAFSFAFGGSGGFFVCYGVVCMSGITMSLISFDERYHWESYAGVMPLSRKQLVAEKYLLHLLMVLVWLPVMVVIQRFQQEPAFGGSLTLLLAAGLNIGLLLPGILLPILFALGVEKGRVGYYVVFLGGMILAAVSDDLASAGSFVPEALGSALLMLLPVVVYGVSWRIATRLYEKRVL